MVNTNSSQSDTPPQPIYTFCICVMSNSTLYSLQQPTRPMRRQNLGDQGHDIVGEIP